MIRISELRHKDVIDASDGRRLGYINDIEIDTSQGCVSSIVLPKESRFFSLFVKGEETVLHWQHIKKIGVDVILVDKDQPTPTVTAAEAMAEEILPARETQRDEFDFFEF